MAAVDMAILLRPTETEMSEARGTAQTAREALADMGANPFVALLDRSGLTEPR